MTIAIGAYCIEGVIVCADTNVVATDLVVTSGCKLAGRQSRDGSFVIANAGDDGHAANMLGNEILDALVSRGSTAVEATVKAKMQDWHSGYFQSKAPQMSFVLAAVSAGTRRLYFCEAPNTVLPRRLGEPIAIGIGAQIVDPILPLVITGAVRAEIALLQLAYLMYRAKKDHIFLRGSDTNTTVLLKDGKLIQISEEEMSEAEKLGPEVDGMLNSCLMGLFLRQSSRDDGTFLDVFSRTFCESATKRSLIRFRSLEDVLE